ncbi:MAG TPA: NAD(+) synthase [Sandaracinaceae bacterium LLY-WYZ-13_1]|nr:NAD(+) synthase [Sandaracinaceae bacterium LLY-WYZ-13_1]
MSFSERDLEIDAAAEAERIQKTIRRQVRGEMRRKGAVLGLSGGVDSSVVAALCVRALGPERVLGLFMPEHHTSDDALTLGRTLAASLGIETELEDLGPALEAIGCYARQREAIRKVVPDYGPGWKSKITLPSLLEGERLNVFSLVVESPDGERQTQRLPLDAYLQLVAATNYKQRLRRTTEYYHADRLHYAVAGTPNRLEYDQGFFVKQGDGFADFKPIAHLYKTQVYQLADHLGVPEAIRARTPTTDTYSLEQTQEEFFFALPLKLMDLSLFAHDRGVPVDEAAPVLGLSTEQVERVYRDIESKRRATRYLHMAPLFVEDPDAPAEA